MSSSVFPPSPVAEQTLADPKPLANLPASRTIAVLVDHVDMVGGGYEAELRIAFDRACDRFGYDLLMAR